jgi:hypothetical protein
MNGIENGMSPYLSRVFSYYFSDKTKPYVSFFPCFVRIVGAKDDILCREMSRKTHQKVDLPATAKLIVSVLTVE